MLLREMKLSSIQHLPEPVAQRAGQGPVVFGGRFVHPNAPLLAAAVRAAAGDAAEAVIIVRFCDEHGIPPERNRAHDLRPVK